MGNAASCKACGSDKALKTSGSDNDLSQHTDYTDYYRAAGYEVDDPLVRVGKECVFSCCDGV